MTAPVKGRKSFICFDEDTTVKNIKQAIDMGFDVPELIKRFTSAGTGPGQGGIPGHNLPLFTARYQAAVPGATPLPTTARVPLVPTLVATYAGAYHDMSKRTPLDELQSNATEGYSAASACGSGRATFRRTSAAARRSSTCATTWACWTAPPWASSASTGPTPSRPSSASTSATWPRWSPR